MKDFGESDYVLTDGGTADCCRIAAWLPAPCA